MQTLDPPLDSETFAASIQSVLSETDPARARSRKAFDETIGKGGSRHRRGCHADGPRGRVAAPLRVPRGWSEDGSRRRRGCRAERAARAGSRETTFRGRVGTPRGPQATRQDKWTAILTDVHSEVLHLPLWGKRIPAVINNQRLKNYKPGYQQFEYLATERSSRPLVSTSRGRRRRCKMIENGLRLFECGSSSAVAPAGTRSGTRRWCRAKRR